MGQSGRGRHTRAQVRAAELAKAAKVNVPTRADVCVVGGGAAGLVAGIVAAEQGARTMLLERSPEAGRTILATGNGRCNFANRTLDPSRYNDPAFVRACSGNAWLEDVLGFFDKSGLAWAEEGEGRLYPLSRQAASVRNVLLARATRSGVVVACARALMSIDTLANGLTLHVDELWPGGSVRTLTTDAVVVATGGCTAPNWRMEGLNWTPGTPLLCPISCDGPALQALDGRRAHALVTLCRCGQELSRECGEVLFRTYGLSGIAVFNLSRHARPGDELRLDLLPDLTTDEAQRLAAHTPDGILDPTITRALTARFGPAADVVAAAKHLTYTVRGTAETNRAQVTRGGLATAQFDPATLGAREQPGLFACGEALDVDGPCGGFNLAWAWKSGMVAGLWAARYAMGDDHD